VSGQQPPDVDLDPPVEGEPAKRRGFLGGDLPVDRFESVP
jgi:hypothetical protein